MVFIEYSCCQRSILGITEDIPLPILRMYILMKKIYAGFGPLPILGMYILKRKDLYIFWSIYTGGEGIVSLCLHGHFVTEECSLLYLFGVVRNLHFIS